MSLILTFPQAYFITFTTYGTWLHGGKETSVDLHSNTPGYPRLARNIVRENFASMRMQDPKLILDTHQRSLVLQAIQKTCVHCQWSLFAAHVRTNHIHVVLAANHVPEKIMGALKAYAARALNELDEKRRRWTRHGSTRYLWKNEQVWAAMRYVVYEQGVPMAVFNSGSYGLLNQTSEPRPRGSAPGWQGMEGVE